ncbi:ASF1 [Enterospora canceri]|uniref:Anti-silencing function protein 1 n=1 Tax=Enterospora canceri TaxID=1081671 RepID=A0A1Y1S631_9MICR|nr:ASF1 [Enterospora canceri]
MSKEEKKAPEESSHNSTIVTGSDEYDDYTNSIIQLKNVRFDTNKTYKYTDNLKFNIDLDVKNDIEDDIKVEVIYFGSYGSEEDEQVLVSAAVGPLKQGGLTFEIETEKPIELHKIPLKALFGLNTFLVSLTYKESEFARVGFVVNVTYPGVNENELICEDFTDSGEYDTEEESSESVEFKSNEGEEVKEEAKVEEAKIEEVKAEEAKVDDVNEKENKINSELDQCVPADKDEFDFKTHKMVKDKIEYKFMKDPIVQIFGIPGCAEAVGDEEVKKAKN